MPLTAAEETIIITRVLREAADRMMEQAYKDRDSSKLSLEDFFAVSERYQQIQNECNRAVHEAASRLPRLPKELAAIGDATKQLETALKTVTGCLGHHQPVIEAFVGTRFAGINHHHAEL
jgi:hypothetical protein